MVLTEQKDTMQYRAGFELDYRPRETAIFTKITETAFPIAGIGNYPTDPNANSNEYTSMLNGLDRKTGASLTMKVMSGDKVDLGVQYWYPKFTDIKPDEKLTVEDLFGVLLSTLATNAAGLSDGKTTPQQLEAAGSPVYNGLGSFLSTQDNEQNQAGQPKAFLNWILLDEQFNYVPSGSGYMRVAAYTDELGTLAQSGITIPRNGYLFVYLSNETKDENVFFDNLAVNHYTGPLVEETHYYPFGLTMAGISSKAAGRLENKLKFIHQPLDDDLGLNWYQFKYRNHDPQTGRFVEIDPLADKYVHNSTYAYAENRVINGIDLEGLEYVNFLENPAQWVATIGEGFSDKKGGLYETLDWFNRNINPVGIVAHGLYSTSTGKDFMTGESVDRGTAFCDMGVNGIGFLTFFRGGGALKAETTLESQMVKNSGKAEAIGAKGLGQAAFEEAESASAGSSSFSLKQSYKGEAQKMMDNLDGGFGKRLEASKKIPTITEQAAAISKQIGKNSISIKTPNKAFHFDLQGAAHKGVPTPHVQQSLPNMNPITGQMYWNKDRQWVEAMTQKDIRIIKNYLKKQ
jgi:RHS repeat-associated protein